MPPRILPFRRGVFGDYRAVGVLFRSLEKRDGETGTAETVPGVMGWGRGDGLGDGARTMALVEGDAGVEGAGVGVEGFHDWEASGDDAEVYFEPGGGLLVEKGGDGRRGGGGGTVHFCDGDADSIPWGLGVSLLGGEGVGGNSVHDRSFDLIW